jgi:hypothetical protein
MKWNWYTINIYGILLNDEILKYGKYYFERQFSN